MAWKYNIFTGKFDYYETGGGSSAVTSVFGRTGDVVAQTGDYTWAQIDKTASDIADITNRSHTSLTDIGTYTHAQIDSHIDSTSNPHNVMITQLTMPNIPTSTYDDVKDWWDTTISAGKLTGGDFTDNGDGTVKVSAGTGIIKTTDSDVGESKFFDWSETDLTLADGTNYIYVKYNSGSPVVTSATSLPSDKHTNVMLGLVYKEGTTLHIMPAGQVISDFAMKTTWKDIEVNGKFQRVSGLIIGETGTRNISLTSGVIYAGLTKTTIPAFDSSGTDTFDYYYRDGSGGFTKVSGQTQIDNTHYDDGSGTLAELSNPQGWRTYYGVHWVYQDIDGHVGVLYGRGNYLLSDAEAALPPSDIPDLYQQTGRLVGKIIIKKNADTFTACLSPFVTAFSPSGATDHTNLLNLTWTSSGHTGTASTLAGFDSDGNPTEYTESNYALTDGSRAFDTITIDNVNIDGNFISTSSGDLNFKSYTNWYNFYNADEVRFYDINTKKRGYIGAVADGTFRISTYGAETGTQLVIESGKEEGIYLKNAQPALTMKIKTDMEIYPTNDKDISLGESGKAFSNVYTYGVTSSGGNLILDAGSSYIEFDSEVNLNNKNVNNGNRIDAVTLRILKPGYSSVSLTASNYGALVIESGHNLNMDGEIVGATNTNWDDAYNKRVDTWTAPLSFSSNTASISKADSSTDGYLASGDFTHFQDAYDKRVDTWTNGLQYSYHTASIKYDPTNLTFTGTGQITTIQDINTSSSPTFDNMTITGADAEANPFQVGDGTEYIKIWHDGSLGQISSTGNLKINAYGSYVKIGDTFFVREGASWAAIKSLVGNSGIRVVLPGETITATSTATIGVGTEVVGINQAGTIIDAGTLGSNYVFELHGYATLRNLKIQGLGSDSKKGVYITSYHNRVDNIRFYWDVTDTTIADSITIKIDGGYANKITNCWVHGGGAGIEIVGNYFNNIENVYFINTCPAIVIMNQYNQVENCQLYSVHGYGIELKSGAKYCTIIGNTGYSDNTGYIVRLDSGANNNVVVGNRGGVSNAGSSNTVTGNQ